MVRETLGENAIIVATGEEARNKTVRVVAAIEPAFEINTGGMSDGGWLQYDEEGDTDAVAEEITDMLLRHAVTEDVMDHIISCVTVMGYEETGIALVESLGQLYKFNSLPVSATKTPTMMIGAPGSGKTLAVAKMAARGVLNGKTISVITTDTVRAGGVEQLKAFTDLMNITLVTVSTPQDLQHVTQDLQAQSDQVIIDTYGLNPFNTDEIRTLARMIGASGANPVMVLPGGIDSDEAGEMARVFATLGAKQLIATRTDIARRLGGLLSAAHQGSLSFADVSNTPKVAQGLEPLTPNVLARLLMPAAYRNKSKPPVNQRPLTENTQQTKQSSPTQPVANRLHKTGIKQ